MGFIQFLFGKKEKILEDMSKTNVTTKTTMEIAGTGSNTTGSMDFNANSGTGTTIQTFGGGIKSEVKPVKARFEVFKSKSTKGDWYFRLLAPNNKIICVSEGYTRKVNALNGIASVKKNAGPAKIEVV